jgi:hypothetical protein
MAQDLFAPSQSCAISVSKYPGSVRTAQGTELARLVQHSPSDWYPFARPLVTLQSLQLSSIARKILQPQLTFVPKLPVELNTAVI